jgi:HAD superfamily hydrolase (TIGR01509 family)
VAIRVVAFDLMDTVVRDPFREALEAATGLGLRELFERRDPTVYPAFERGEIDEPAYWAHYETAGITVDPAAFHRIRREGIAFLPGMAELLDDLAGLVERVTASNYPVWVEELAREHLGGRFERIIASYHLGIRKPDRGFFDRLVDELEVSADEVCFVDDRHDNVEAARQAGLRAQRFTDATALRGWLADHGVPLRREAPLELPDP